MSIEAVIVGTTAYPSLMSFREQRAGRMTAALAALPPDDGLACHAMGLADFGKLAAEVIDTSGWTRNKMFDLGTGAVCMHGALKQAARHSSELAEEDFDFASMLFTLRGATMSWNDERSRTREEVLDALRARQIGDTECRARFGPQWREIVVAMRAAAGTVHGSDKFRLDDDVAQHPVMRRFGFDAVMRAICAELELRLDERFTHSAPARTESDTEEMFAQARWYLTSYRDRQMWGTAQSMAMAGLLLRDRLPREVYDSLTAPWRRQVGPLHGDDAVAPLCTCGQRYRAAEMDRAERNRFVTERVGAMAIDVDPVTGVRITVDPDMLGHSAAWRCGSDVDHTLLMQWCERYAVVPPPRNDYVRGFQLFKAPYGFDPASMTFDSAKVSEATWGYVPPKISDMKIEMKIEMVKIDSESVDLSTPATMEQILAMDKAAALLFPKASPKIDSTDCGL